MIPFRRIIFSTLLVTICAAPSLAVETPIRIISPHPADDYSPAISPDGRWLVFVSERDGVSGLYTARLDQGAAVIPRPHLRHPARTHSPVFSPDGKMLAFVSHRNDALGDVYIQEFPTGVPERLTPRGVPASDPLFSPDGRQLHFLMGTLLDDPYPHVWSLATRETTSLDEAPRFLDPMPEYPLRALDVKGAVALAYAEDTNRDGLLGPGDDPVAIILDQGVWRQISYPIPDAHSIARVPGTTRSIVAARFGESLDLGVIDNPLLGPRRSAEELARDADELLESRANALEMAIALYRQAVRQEPIESQYSIRLLQLLSRAGRHRQVQLLAGEMLEKDFQSVDADIIRSEMLAAKAEDQWLTARRNGQRFEPPSEMLAELQEIRERLENRIPRQDPAEVVLKLARIRLLSGNPTAAIQVSSPILLQSVFQPSPDLLARVYILHSQAFQALGLAGETRDTLISIFNLGISDQAILDEAAALLIDIVTAGATADQQRLLALRNLAAQVSNAPHALARVRLAEATLLASPGMDRDRDAWRSALNEAASLLVLAPLPALDASLLLLDDQMQQGGFEAAFDRAESILMALEPLGGPQRYPALQTIRTRIIHHFLESARQSALLGDWSLARATWTRLLEYDPDNIEAWRGRIQSLSIREELLDEAIALYRREARERGAPALSHYKYGLALSYRRPDSDEALRHVRLASERETSPYFLLTEGFILEQQFRRTRERRRPAAQLLEEALDVYQRALGILDPGTQVQLHADLLLNSANASLGLDQYLRAHDFYTRRTQTGVSFADPRTEMIYHWNAGIAAWRAVYPSEAAQHFRQALDRLPALERRGLIEPQQIETIRQELMGRRALALRDRNPGSEEAEALFTLLAESYPSDSLAAARAHRNVAFLREYRARSVTDATSRRQLLVAARASALNALQILGSPNLELDPEPRRSGAWFTFTAVVSSQGGRAEGFTPAEETALLHGLVARVAEALGDGHDAINQYNRQLAARSPGMATTPYEAAIRSVTSNRLSGLELRSGDPAAAFFSAAKGLASCRIDTGRVEEIDINGATHHLLRMSEILSHFPEKRLAVPRGTFWMLGQHDDVLKWNTLRDAAQALLVYRPKGSLEGAPPPATELAIHYARLILLSSQADSAELDSLLRSLPSLGVPLIHQASQSVEIATRLYRQTRMLREMRAATPEFRRILLLMESLTLQAMERIGDQAGSEEVLKSALEQAERSGHTHLIWWLHVSAGLSTSDPDRRLNHLGRGLEEFLSAPIRFVDQTQPFPWDVMDAAEMAHLRLLIGSGNLVEAWNRADDWRRARLAVIAEMSEIAGNTSEERSWIIRFIDARRRFADVQRQLQRLPHEADSDRFALRLRATRIATEIQEMLGNARDRGFSAAHWYLPESGGFDTAALVFDLPRVEDSPPTLVLHRLVSGERILVVYTPDGQDAPLEDLSGLPEAGELLVLGDPLDNPRTTLLLTSTSVLNTSLSTRPQGVVYSLDVDGFDVREMATASTVVASQPLTLRGFAPSTWYGRGGNTSLQQAIRHLGDAERVQFTIDADTFRGISEQSARRLSVASHLHRAGVAEAHIDGDRWLGRVLDPRLYTEEATIQRGEQLGRWLSVRDQPASASKATILERIAYLSEVLGETNELSSIYGVLADTRGALGQWRAATAAQRRAVELITDSGSHVLAVAAAQGRLGDAATRARDWSTARAAYDAALDIARALEDHTMILSLMSRLADAREWEGDYDAALDLSRQLVVLKASVSRQEQAAEHVRAARILRVYQSKFHEALQELSAAASITQGLGLVDSPVIFEIAINRARVLQSLALFDAATDQLNSLERDVELARAASNPLVLDRRLAEISLERANTAWLRSDYFDAFTALQDVLRLTSTRDDMDDIRIAQLNASGLTAWAVNDHIRARSDLDAALILARAAGLPDLVATTHNNIGLVYRSQGDHDSALESFNRALRMDRDLLNRWGEAYSLRNIGITYTLAGRAPEAIPPLREAIRLTRDIGDRLNEAKALTALGDALLAVGDNAEARDVYTTAEMLAATTPVPEMHWRALYGLGRERIATGRPREALPHLREAINVVDLLRASIRVEEFQDGFLLDKQDLFDLTITTLLDVGESAAAMETSEQSRGRNFIDLLGNRTVSLGSVQDNEDRQRADELRAALIAAQARLAGSALEDRPAVEAEVTRATREYEDFLLTLRARNPQLAGFVRVDPASVGEMRQWLDGETALVVYHLLHSEIVILLLTHDDLHVSRVPVDSEEITRLVGRARVGIQNIENVERELLELSRYLLAPIQPRLSGISRLGIIPHRELHLLPFAALIPGPGEYLIDRLALFYSPSASLLRYTMGGRGERRLTGRVLAIGNPELPGMNMDLPFAQKEAERLVFEFDQVTLRTGAEATEGWIRDNIADYDLVHIASHGEFVPDSPLDSALLLAPTDDSRDGRLSAAEIFGLSIRADLITLSACQTGLGRITAGDEVVGLNRAFVYAGTRQLLSTLWRVDDLSTALLFKHFYRDLASEDRAEALRRAQIRLKDRPEFSHPAHWSSVVLSGDWR